MSEILVIDDDTAVRELFYDMLSRQGHAVFTAGSGMQALEMLKGRRPHLIFLDSTLPEASSTQIVKELRSVDDTVPIIVLNGADNSPSTPESAQLRQLGVTETLNKQLGPELLFKTLEASMPRWQKQRSAAIDTSEVHVRGTLLVIDDDPQIQKLLKWFFETKGLRVIVAGSGEEGIRALSHQPLAVLLDMTMPGMDGLIALKKIKAAHPSLPVIMASGVGEEAVIREALDAGAYDFVSKPFNLEYLETVVLTKVLLGMDG